MVKGSINLETQNAVLVFSGGQDSTTCLHWALKNFQSVHPVFFRYGQRHGREEIAAKKIAGLNGLDLKIFDLNLFAELGGNSLVDNNMDIESPPGKLPNTFVPGRNIIFLTHAAAYAYFLKCKHLVTGVCQTDYSGYPDCREDTLKSLENTLSLGLDSPMTIHTPLMHLTKAQTVLLAKKLGALESLAHSHTCYEGKFPPCGKCPACLLRSRGFAEAGIADPLLQNPAPP